MTSPAKRAENLIRHYFEMCNQANRQGLIDCFTFDAVHYFPPGLDGAPWRGAEAIADGWVGCVKKLGSKWTIERMLTSPDGSEGVIEWTHWKTKNEEVLRGDEWYIFNKEGTKIKEIRAYYASSVNKAEPINGLEGFDYENRGYAMHAPAVEGRN